MNKDERIAELEEELIDATNFKDSYYHDLKELKKENQLLRKTLNNLKGDKASDTLANAVNSVYEPLLQDKFDDIERLKKELKTLRHEICEKIRNYIDKEIYDRFQDNDVDYLTIDLEDFEDLLDQIERGEE